MIDSIEFVQDPLLIATNEETFLQDFLVIVKHSIQNYYGYTTSIMINLGCLKLQLYNSVLPVVKGLSMTHVILIKFSFTPILFVNMKISLHDSNCYAGVHTTICS